MTSSTPLLLDCTRAVARHWAGRQPSGIDRVCDAYIAHFAARAQAVVQLRGKARVLSVHHSRGLFGLLQEPIAGFRRRFARFAPSGFAAGQTQMAHAGALYLNVSHTDFDLPAHSRWVRKSGLRPIYFVHDLIPIMHPQWTTKRRVARHRGRIVGALKEASGIIVNSRATAQNLMAFAADQGLATPPLLSAPLAAADFPQVALRSAVSGKPYFVCISTIEARKNHLILLRVWQRLIAQYGEDTPQLILIGKWGIGSAEVRRFYEKNRMLSRFVAVRSGCNDAEVASLLVGARALLAPSMAEGFGLPVAEALKYRIPVIASKLPSFVELGGDIPHYLDPDDFDGWLSAVQRFVVDGPERTGQLALLDHYRAPCWEDHFQLLESWLAQQYSGAEPEVASSGQNAPFILAQGALSACISSSRQTMAL